MHGPSLLYCPSPRICRRRGLKLKPVACSQQPVALTSLPATGYQLLHLYRYTIRPRFRSYGLSSTATRSPGKMRMKFLRILPETCASTSWFVSSFTLNMALGNVSTTVAMTSIASSFDKRYPLLGASAPSCFGPNYLLLFGQNL